jgi:methylene-fatty-acyl-phospholipid synthase
VPELLGLVAALLALERITYALVWRKPGLFRAWSARRPLIRLGGPVNVLAALFVAFKVLQFAVFVGWHLALGDGSLRPHANDPRIAMAGLTLIAVGQGLNVSVFRLLGKVGVFYGNRFGYTVSWTRRFPFTWFPHPQYLGTVLSIWGFFILMRFPAPDWIIIPAVESIYYVAGAYVERDPGEGAEASSLRHGLQGR